MKCKQSEFIKNAKTMYIKEFTEEEFNHSRYFYQQINFVYCNLFTSLTDRSTQNYVYVYK